MELSLIQNNVKDELVVNLYNTNMMNSRHSGLAPRVKAARLKRANLGTRLPLFQAST